MILPKRKIRRSMSCIKKMLELSVNPYLALSFGKDSLVMLDLVRQMLPDVPCLFLKSTESDMMHEFSSLEKQYKAQGVNVKVVKTDRWGDYGNDWEVSRKAGNKDFYLDDFLQYDGVFMGLRIEESKARRITLISKKNNVEGDRIMRYSGGARDGTFRCCPVADWTGFEILHYLRTKKLPYLEAYDVSGESTRTTARLTGDAVRNYTLMSMKVRDISRWNTVIKDVPELKFFT